MRCSWNALTGCQRVVSPLESESTRALVRLSGRFSILSPIACVLGLAFILAAGPAVAAEHSHTATPKTQHGKASVYSSKFHGKKMANGETFSAGSSAAASKTLPLGTKAKVTNLETGKSAEVTVKDRGNLPKDRIMDVSPKTADQIGITKKAGVAPVKVEP